MKILTRRAFFLTNFPVQLCQLPPLKPPGGKMCPQVRVSMVFPVYGLIHCIVLGGSERMRYSFLLMPSVFTFPPNPPHSRPGSGRGCHWYLIQNPKSRPSQSTSQAKGGKVNGRLSGLPIENYLLTFYSIIFSPRGHFLPTKIARFYK